MLHEEFMAFVTDDASYQAVRGVAEKQGWPPAVVQMGGVETAQEIIAAGTPPRVLLVDVDGVNDAVGLIARLLATAKDSRVLAIGTANDIVLYRALLAAGVADYLPKPVQTPDVTQALLSALRGPEKKNDPAAEPEAKLIVVLGARGGVGASTLATNLAWHYAHTYGKQTVLLDLDLAFGTSALALDLEPGRGLREALENPSRLDSLLIASSMVNESEKLSVMAAEEPVDEGLMPDPNALPLLLKELRKNAQIAVVDLPRDGLVQHRRLIPAAQTLILVTEQTLSGIRDTMRLKNAAKALGFEGLLLVIASRVGKERPAQVDIGAFEKGLQAKPDFTLPEDGKTMAQAANQGKAIAVVAADSAFNKNLREIAEKAAGIEPSDPKKKGGKPDKKSADKKSTEKKA